MFLDQMLCLGCQRRFESIAAGEFHNRFDPEFRLAVGMLHVHVRPWFFAEKK